MKKNSCFLKSKKISLFVMNPNFFPDGKRCDLFDRENTKIKIINGNY